MCVPNRGTARVKIAFLAINCFCSEVTSSPSSSSGDDSSNSSSSKGRGGRFEPFDAVNELCCDKRPPHPQTILRSVTSGTSRDFWKNDDEIIIGFYFFTYECCRRRLPLIKMINGVEEVLILLFTAFRVRVLVLKYRRTRLNSEVIYS